MDTAGWPSLNDGAGSCEACHGCEVPTLGGDGWLVIQINNNL